MHHADHNRRSCDAEKKTNVANRQTLDTSGNGINGCCKQTVSKEDQQQKGRHTDEADEVKASFINQQKVSKQVTVNVRGDSTP